ALVGPVAGVEHHRREASAGVTHLEAVAAPVDARLDAGGGVGGGVHGAGGDAPRPGDGLVGPAAIVAVPLPVPLEALELPLQALGLGDLAVGADEDRLKARRLAPADLALEQRADADAGAAKIDGQRHLSL